MGCNIDQVIRGFGDHEISFPLFNNPAGEFQRARLLSETTIMEPGTLYVGLSSHLAQTDFYNRNITLLCLGSVDVNRNLTGTARLNILCLNTAMSLEDVFNRILTLFQRYESNDGNSDGLYRSLFYGRGIQTILDIGWEMLSNPIYLVTENGELVAKSTDMRVPDVVCEELHTLGIISEKTSERLFDETLSKLQQIPSGTVLFKKDYLLYDRILGKTRLTADEKGYIVVLEINRPFRPEDHIIVQMLCSAVEHEMEGTDQREDVNSIKKETLITDLLDGTIAGQDHLLARLNRIHWRVPSAFRLLLLKMTVSSKAYLSFYRNLYQQAFPESDVCIYKDALIILMPNERDHRKRESRRQKLEELLEETNMRCMVSSEAASLLDVRKAYIQAQNLLDVSRQAELDNPIVDGDSYLLHSMLNELMQYKDLMTYCHPVLQSIREYDKENNGVYEQTLYTYLKNGKDLLKTFEDLHIHRNTLSYRLNRLWELFGVDFNDGYMLTQILISFEILRMKKTYHKRS